MNKNISALRLLTMLILSFCLQSVMPDGVRMDTCHTVFAQANKQQPPQLDKLISELYSQDENRRQKAKISIITFSQESEDLRRQVIARLLKTATLSHGCAEALSSEQRFLEWNEATDILGAIKATEAVDVLIDAMDCTIGESLSTDAYPATKAIVKIGDDAVPKLIEALEHKPVGIRYMAARALYEIGGVNAKYALEKAVRKEKDKKIRSLIQYMLGDWNNSGKHKC